MTGTMTSAPTLCLCQGPNPSYHYALPPGYHDSYSEAGYYHTQLGFRRAGSVALCEDGQPSLGYVQTSGTAQPWD